MARELTKVHEEFLRGTAAELRRARITLKAIHVAGGEGGATGSGRRSTVRRPWSLACARDEPHGCHEGLAREPGLSKRDVYREVEEADIEPLAAL